VDPELKTAHQTLLLLRHFRVNNAPSRCHPLDVAAAQMTFIAQMILVQHMAVEHIGDGFKAPVRVRRKTGYIVVRIVRIEFIQHQEGIESRMGILSQAAVYAHASAIAGGASGYELLQFELHKSSDSGDGRVFYAAISVA